MATEPIQGGPYPVPADPPDGPSQMKAILDWAAGRLNMRFASAAARDAALPTPVAGMECAIGSGSTQVKYIYTGTAWKRLWTPTLNPEVQFGTAAVNLGASGLAAGATSATMGPFPYPVAFSGIPTVVPQRSGTTSAVLPVAVTVSAETFSLRVTNAGTTALAANTIVNFTYVAGYQP